MGKEKISFGEKIAYGGGDFASNLVNILIASYATFFYTDALGLNPAIIGSIMLFSRFADGFSDIIMGWVMDRTKSKYGKARPWILWISIPISISMVMLFLVPNLGDLGKYIYIAITYNLVITFMYTMINLPYGALNSLMTRNQNERMSINVFRMFMSQGSSLIVSMVTLPLVNAVGGSQHQKSWVIVSIIYGIIASVCFLLCFAKTKERVVISSQQKEKIPFKKAVSVLFRNKYWGLLLVIYVFVVFRQMIDMGAATYYSKYVLGDENIAGLMSAMMFLPALIMIPLLSPISKKLGKRNIALIGSLIALFGQVLVLVNPESAVFLIVCAFIRGIGMACISGTIFAMVADAIEYGQWKTGIRVEGMLYSSVTFGAKAGAGISSALVLGVMGAAGYDGTAAIQSASAMAAIRGLYLYATILFAIIVPILYGVYKLDKIYPQMMEDLEKRENEMTIS